MSASASERRDELIAAALADDLSHAERIELDALRALDPTIDRELEELGALTGALEGITWTAERPAPGLAARIASISAPAPAPIRRIPRWMPVVAAAACVALGAGITLGAQAISSAPPRGEAGTLGVVEAVDFTGEPSGVRVDGALVAHTWGTETVLEIDGLVEDTAFAVVLVGRDGSRSAAGSFTGSAVRIDCRMNAAIDRADVAAVEIADATGDVVAHAEVAEI